MRLIRLLAFLLLLPPLGAADVELVRVWPGYRTADSFVGIREYFGRPEAASGRTILRSQPADRSGYYWLLRTRSTEVIPGAVVELSIIRPGRTEAETHRFPAPLPAGSQPVLVGLTGADWPDPEQAPLAWRIRILDADGTPLAEERSFLWSLPEPDGGA